MYKSKTLFLCMQLIAVLFVQQVSAGFELKYDDNRFSLIASRISIQKILNHLHEKTGVFFEFDSNLLINENISVNINTTKLENGIEKLLKNYNKIFIYNNNNQVTKVQIVNRLNNSNFVPEVKLNKMLDRVGDNEIDNVGLMVGLTRLANVDVKAETATNPDIILSMNQMADDNAGAETATNPDIILSMNQITGNYTGAETVTNSDIILSMNQITGNYTGAETVTNSDIILSMNQITGNYTGAEAAINPDKSLLK